MRVVRHVQYYYRDHIARGVWAFRVCGKEEEQARKVSRMMITIMIMTLELVRREDLWISIWISMVWTASSWATSSIISVSSLHLSRVAIASNDDKDTRKQRHTETKKEAKRDIDMEQQPPATREREGKRRKTSTIMP